MMFSKEDSLSSPLGCRHGQLVAEILVAEIQAGEGRLDFHS